MDESSHAEPAPPEVDTSVAHSARVYNWMLGGKDNFAADRAMGEAMLQLYPAAREMVWQNRRFVGRAVRYLVGEGVRQFLDIGTGIPAAGNTHEVAQEIAPAARVVYVDNDPIVLAHARALLVSGERGRTDYIHADLREPDVILGDPAVAATLDLSQPVGLMIVAVLHNLSDDDAPVEKVRTVMDALPSGSYLVLTHPTGDAHDPETVDRAVTTGASGGMPVLLRTRSQVERFFGDWQLVDPGLVPVRAWRPDTGPPIEVGTDTPTATPADAGTVGYWAGVARKP